ncbi:class I SAM-dependent methyltransferase [Sulfurospirillum arcachonense]|uniref:class I SAM-dependent methyltransferase n=1 Tax=Sulfurospirillum arcachonense TaxID=57666 RepID=UPI000468F1BA|nr:methyltransferase domain-containing protein [Sulfurospirillum arcachonense]
MSNLRVKYQTVEFNDIDIHTCILRDNQQYEDIDNEAEDLGISSASWPLFGQIWPSSKVLASLMSDFDIKNKRILEVGCGIGLASLVLNHRLADITATDYHPQVQKFLNRNSLLNNDEDIPFERTGWSDNDDTLGKFDLIIGSDLLYERDHAHMLSEFINAHANKNCEIIIIDPGRGNQGKFTKMMIELGYTYTCKHSDEIDTEINNGTFKIHSLVR